MKEYRSFICDYCGAVYSARQEAEICEKRHHSPTGNKTYLYRGPDSDYPDAVKVDFDNGVSRVYSLQNGYQYLSAERNSLN